MYVYIVCDSVYCDYFGVLIDCCVSELHAKLCPHWPEAVYCCFTRTTLFTKLFTCFYDQSYRLLLHHQVSLLYTFWVSEIAKCIA